MKTEDVNAQVAAEWPAIAARDKIAFFAFDVARIDGPQLPVCTVNQYFADDGSGTDEAWALVRQRFGQFCAAVRNAVAPRPDGGKDAEWIEPALEPALPSLGELEAVCLRLSQAATVLAYRARVAGTQDAKDPDPAPPCPAPLTRYGPDMRADGRAPLAAPQE